MTKPHAGESDLRERDPELYGLLLLANQKIANVGTTLIWVLGLAVILLCVGIHQRWFSSIAGLDVESLRGFGVYFVIAIAAFIAFGAYTRHSERRTYLDVKPEILESLRRRGGSMQALVAQIARDKDLGDIKEQLLDDPDNRPVAGGEEP